MKPLRFDDEAEEEIAAAIDWYEEKRPGLGGTFLAKLDEVSTRIQETPLAHPRAPGVPDVPVRRAVVSKYPYTVVFIELPDEIRVLAVAHDRRRPGYWRDRLRK